MALEDALILSNLLDSLQQSSDIEAAFRTFALAQRPRTHIYFLFIEPLSVCIIRI